jgi:glycosyltransferase involved in cell wall biosynthesis
MNKTLEYLAYELPVVAFKLTETVVSAGPAAEYVEPSSDTTADNRCFAEMLVALLDDPERRATMGRVGRERIESGLGWPASARTYLGAYDRLTGRRTSIESAA